MEESIFKLFIMGWNEIAGDFKSYKKHWDENLKGTELLRCKTRLIMEEAKKGPIKEFDPKLMIKVMDYIMVFESGELKKSGSMTGRSSNMLQNNRIGGHMLKEELKLLFLVYNTKMLFD